MNIKILGIDLAKNLFQLHGVDENGKVILRQQLKREKLAEFIVKLPPCLIGMEACSSAHHWARKFQAMGHTVKLMAPQFVKPYVKSNKNDANDAEGICEAVSRPSMRFVPLKHIEQHDIEALHRVRSQLVKQRTAQANQIRGLLAEYGIIIPKGISHIRKSLPLILEDAENELTALTREIFSDLYEHLKALEEKVKLYTHKIELIAAKDERCQRLCRIEGIGPLSATAVVAAVGDGKVFNNGRQMAAWLGLVPKQHSSGGRTQLLGISKRGDKYIRTLLIHGGRAVTRTCTNKQDTRSLWIADKKQRCGENKTAVAVANKNVRIMWALLSSGATYQRAVILKG
jgi:transposase